MAYRTQGAQPGARMRTACTHDDECIWSAGHENLEDFREGEQLATYLVHPVAAIRDVNLVGLHVGPSDGGGELLSSIVDDPLPTG